MQPGQPSRTALSAAAHRAAHQILEEGRIFADPLALRILGQDEESLLREAQSHPLRRVMRLFIAVRTRFAEDALAAAVERGARQLVVLGAGLDTYAYRSPFGDRLRVFEVDYPATQAWKRRQLAAAGIPVAGTVTFAAVDFERQKLAEGLAEAGFECGQQTFFTWLGVVPYLTAEAVWETLGFIAGLSGGAHVVFDYGEPPEVLEPEARQAYEAYRARVASLGEAWICHFEAEKLQATLAALGFVEVEDLGPPEIAARYFPSRAEPARDRGGHILRASTLRPARPVGRGR